MPHGPRVPGLLTSIYMEPSVTKVLLWLSVVNHGIAFGARGSFGTPLNTHAS